MDMHQLFYKYSKSFSTKKVSVKQAIKVLERNGILVNEEKAEIILDFLYLIAKTYSDVRANDDCLEFEPKT